MLVNGTSSSFAANYIQRYGVAPDMGSSVSPTVQKVDDNTHSSHISQDSKSSQLVVDAVTISAPAQEALLKSRQKESHQLSGLEKKERDSNGSVDENDDDNAAKSVEGTDEESSLGVELSESEQQEVRKLQQRDAEVKVHEAAHVAAAGRYAQGGASFDYETGPDGRRYAVGGDVSISVSAERTPEATIAKMQAVRRAALAPASPSGQDRRVAAEATQKETEAHKALAEEKMTESEEKVAVPGDTASIQSELAPDANMEPAKAVASADMDDIEKQWKQTAAQKSYIAPQNMTRSMEWAM